MTSGHHIDSALRCQHLCLPNPAGHYWLSSVGLWRCSACSTMWSPATPRDPRDSPFCAYLLLARFRRYCRGYHAAIQFTSTKYMAALSGRTPPPLPSGRLLSCLLVGTPSGLITISNIIATVLPHHWPPADGALVAPVAILVRLIYLLFVWLADAQEF